MPAREPIGRLAIVLHSHMPYVEGYGVWPFGEQWLWEVVSASYMRVADVVRGSPVTLGVTPVLADQFDAMRGAAGDRFVAWSKRLWEYYSARTCRPSSQSIDPSFTRRSHHS